MQRSPNYPAVELAVALDAIGKLYKTEGRTPVPAEVAAKAIGYNGLSGPARTKISAMRKYGLADEIRGAVRVSDLGVRILVGVEGSPDLADALRQAALMPELFRELYGTHREASVQAIIHHLVVSKKFTRDGARLAAEMFKRTIALAKLDVEVYSPSVAAEQTASIESLGHVVGTQAVGIESRGPVLQHKYVLPAGARVKAEVTFSGEGLMEGLLASHLTSFIKQLELWRDDLRDDLKAGTEEKAKTT